MSIDELLDDLDEVLEKSLRLPLSGGKCVVDVEKSVGIIEDIRLNMPQEIRQARAIVADRTEIIKNAKEEAESIIKSAEDKAKILVSQEEVMRQAQEKAAELMNDAKTKAKEIKKASIDFTDGLLKRTEDDVMTAQNQLRQARLALKSPVKL